LLLIRESFKYSCSIHINHCKRKVSSVVQVNL